MYHISTMPSTRVVILAAGKGTRMKSDIPKPLISVAGEPMVTRLIRSVKESGVDSKPVVVVGSWSEAMFRSALGDSVDYAVQTEQLGTGHALKSAKEAVGEAGHVIVLYGDHPFIAPSVIKTLTALGEKNPDALVMLTTRVPSFDDKYMGFVSWSRILRDSSGKIIGDRQVKDASEEEKKILELNPCIYAFPAPWVWERLAMLKNENASKEYYLTDVIAMAMQEGKQIATLEVNPLDVIGINSPEELARAEAMIG